MDPQSESSIFDIVIDEESNRFLMETAKWAKVLSILGLVLGVLMAIAGIFISIVGNSLNTFSGLQLGPILGLTYFCLGLVYLYPSWVLLQFATNMPPAIKKDDQLQVNDAFRNLRNCFRFWGILSLVIIALYILLIFGSMIFATFK